MTDNQPQMGAQTKRLNKFISESGVCSRREADRYIEQGNVFLNGKRAQVGDSVKPGDQVRVNGQLIDPMEAEDFVFIALNKPVGIESTTEKKAHNIVDFVNHGVRIFPIGRLDKDSQGLIFLTNNGDLVNKVLRAGNNHEKEYIVTVNKPVNAKFIEGMGAGVPILGTKTKKCPVEKVDTYAFKITLIQGLNRQIRRMCEYFGYDVLKLERIRIMNVDTKGLPVGEWRDLTQKELAVLLKSVEDSSSEAKPGTRKQRSPSRSKSNHGQSKRGSSTGDKNDSKRGKGQAPSRNATGKSNGRKAANQPSDGRGQRGTGGKTSRSGPSAGRSGKASGGRRGR